MNRKANAEEGDGHGGRGAAWQWWVAAAVIIYLAPFIVLWIDERVLRTFWLYHHLHPPDWVADVFRTIYPFYRWFK
jgi:hypothetical protein